MSASTMIAFRLDSDRQQALDAVARRLGVSRSELLDRLVGLAIDRAPTDGWTCRTVRLLDGRIELSGHLDPHGDAGYGTEMALPDGAWDYLDRTAR